MEFKDITTKQLNEFRQTEKKEFAVRAGGGKPMKRLYVTLSGGFEVWVNRELVLSTEQPSIAVDKYNSI